MQHDVQYVIRESIDKQTKKFFRYTTTGEGQAYNLRGYVGQVQHGVCPVRSLHVWAVGKTGEEANTCTCVMFTDIDVDRGLVPWECKRSVAWDRRLQRMSVAMANNVAIKSESIINK